MAAKPGRNDPCPCGSGRKFKHCCIHATAPDERRLAAALAAGAAHHQQGRLREAETEYRRVLAVAPEHPEALHLLGLLALHAGQPGPARELILRALGHKPDAADFFNSLALVERALGDGAAAETALRKAVALQPGFAEAHANLGDSLRWRGRLDEAARSLATAIAHAPGLAAGHHSLGLVFKEQGRAAEAAAALRQALALQPQWAQAHVNLGNVLRDLRQAGAAVDSYRAALDIDPGLAGAAVGLGNTLRDLGRIDEAIGSYERAIAAEPLLVAAHSNLLLTLNYDEDALDRHGAAARARFAHAVAQILGPVQASASAAPPVAPVARTDRRLRVAYVSGDFRRHSVAHFIEPVIAGHDRSRFEVTCYHTQPMRDAVTERIARAADRFHDCSPWSDDELAARIRADGIDILVDLAGHTGHHRLLAFARRPAPLQISWIGYPGSTGLAAIDYQFTDALLSPDDAQQAEHSERLFRLPGIFSCYRPDPDVHPAEARPDTPRAGLTLASYNHGAKLSDAVVRTWSRLLLRLPEARLVLKNHVLADTGACAVVRERFAAQGIEAGRLVLRGHARSGAEHLASYGEVDIALDTFPYCGVTTTCEALWMGVPVVTLAGRRIAARTGVTLLTQLGRSEWIAQDEDEYVAKVVLLAQDAGARLQWRRNARSQMRGSLLMDEAALVRNVETTYRTLWAGRSGATDPQDALARSVSSLGASAAQRAGLSGSE